MVEIQKLDRAEIKRMLLDAVDDAELAVLIDHAEEQRASLCARLLTAPADADDRAQAIVVDVSLDDFRSEVERRAALSPSQRRAEEIARKR